MVLSNINLIASGVTTIACIYNARALGEEQHLRAAELEARAIGPELVRLIAEGYHPTRNRSPSHPE